MKMQNKKSGSATLLVLSVLAVASVIGFSFLYMSQVQLRGANTYLARLQAKYLSEAGINHARQVLVFDKQANSFDSEEDLWRTAFAGTDVDINNDGQPDSKWFYVKDDNGIDMGRYAVLVEDESGKININSAGQYNEAGFIQGYSTFEISLKKFFDNLNLNGQVLTTDIIKYRYGPDQSPGKVNTDDNDDKSDLENDFLDNDADGLIDEAGEGIDEPAEFNIERPREDDRPFAVIDELKQITGITKDIFKNIAGFVTVSSKDKERDAQGAMRQNISYIKSDNLLKIMIDKGVSGPWQKAVNIVDSLERNLARTTIYEHYNLLQAVDGHPTGSWIWLNDRYECNIPGGTSSWLWENLPFGDGEYYCFIYGAEQESVGDVEIDAVIQRHMQNGDAFVQTQSKKVSVENGRLSLSIQNNEEFGKTCYFKYLELIPQDLSGGSALLTREFHGVEAVRINEIMVKPKIERNTSSDSGPGGYWVWQNGLFVNAQPQSGQQGEGTWVFTDLPNGYYYLRLFGQEGEFIGDAQVNSTTQNSMRNGDYFTATQTQTVNVSSNQLIIKIQNNFQDKTCYFKGILLSQQPDTEYVELINISDKTVDLSGWILETTGQEAVSAFVPQGTLIAPYDYLVLCVDKDDQAQGISSNNISFINTWAIQKAVQMDFFRTLDRDFDFLRDVPLAGENYLILKDSKGFLVDKIEYFTSQVIDYFSLERADPTDQRDSNANSEFDAWYLTDNLSGGTPGEVNNNSGMKKDLASNHDIREVLVRNYPASSILDLAYVSQSDNWQRLSLSDIGSIVDFLAVFGTTLSPKNHNITGWTEIYAGEEGFYSGIPGEEGIWQWQDLDNGEYFLAIKGESQEAVTVSYKKSDNLWQILTQDAIPNEEGFVYCGIVSIGEKKSNSTPANVLEIKLVNVSQTSLAHFYYLRLDPLQYAYGRININTASGEVLLSLPNIDEQAALTIINSRPFGNKDGFNKGIGDLFSADLFNNDPDKINKLRTFSNLITVRSNVFKISSIAQVLEQDKVIATQEIKTIVERE